MSSHVLRAALRATRIPNRGLSTTPVYTKNVVLDVKLRDQLYPRIGNREIVGYGKNGLPEYVDESDFPAPSIRFKEDTPDVLKLREKEKGDWKSLTLEDKKSLYRASFGQTYSEMEAPTGDWKYYVTLILAGLTLSELMVLYFEKTVYTELPETFSSEWREKTLEKMIAEGQGHITGVSSKWDYENETWKK